MRRRRRSISTPTSSSSRSTNLTNLQLSLASQKTNQVVRLLTLFSAFFLPLTFVVGIYGMNFHDMPELDERWGYPAVWVVMIAHHARDLSLVPSSRVAQAMIDALLRACCWAARSDGYAHSRHATLDGGVADAAGPHLLPDPAIEWLRASLGAMAIWAVEAERGRPGPRGHPADLGPGAVGR